MGPLPGHILNNSDSTRILKQMKCMFGDFLLLSHDGDIK